MEPTVTKYLIFDHFAGKSTPMQKRLIEEWLHAADNRETYYQWLVEWEHQSPQYLPELDQKLDAYLHFMQENPARPVPETALSSDSTSPVSRSIWLKWLVAATLLLSCGLLGWANKDLLIYKTYQTSYNETRSLQLEDGTRVAMNSNSSLRVPRFGFGSKTREVLLKGEANFSVTHTIDHQRFVVKAENGLEVVVLGTEFTVYSRQRGSKVVLNKGKVQLRYQEGNARKEVMLKPGDLVTLDQQGRASLRKTASPQNYAAWAAHRFVFEGTSLSELTHLFEDNFGLKIKIEGEDLKQLTLYGSFQAQSAEELLQALTDAANLRYTQSNDTITITYHE
ncbi:FecR family protein [Telluribacter sp.]|jgi:ferric-dicitrate binding protein FerR (iron transport regulator)|uniref:FecR family protein n=1 Tax=Telluribacter sp. TaxID=1978767 RepID=UPI002E11C541|nr:FecR domain-containing protein [Telluribacter sp.]